MNTEQMIEVMQAHLKGETVEYRVLTDTEWKHAQSPTWNWYGYSYRVKAKFSVGDWVRSNARSPDIVGEILYIENGLARLRCEDDSTHLICLTTIRQRLRRIVHFEEVK